MKEILNPYIKNNIVTLHLCHGDRAQCVAYNDALQRYRFSCKYMAVIDIDEFIRVNDGRSIVEIVEESLQLNEFADALVIHRYEFGSSNLETADYDKNVTERFLYREKNISEYVKTILNPRSARLFIDPHYSLYFVDKAAINEIGEIVPISISKNPVADKIAINHYRFKSKEEWINKIPRGDAYYLENSRKIDDWYQENFNEIYDDEIIKYISDRKNENLRGGKSQRDDQQRLIAVLKNISPIMFQKSLKISFKSKTHTFLTCWAVIQDLKSNGLSNSEADFLEELSLKCLFQSLTLGEVEIWQVQLLINELPKILSCKYPVVETIRELILNAIPQLKNVFRMRNEWSTYSNLDYILQMLQIKNLSEVQN